MSTVLRDGGRRGTRDSGSEDGGVLPPSAVRRPPSTLADRTLEALEFPKIRETLAAQTGFSASKALALALKWAISG